MLRLILTLTLTLRAVSHEPAETQGMEIACPKWPGWAAWPGPQGCVGPEEGISEPQTEE